LALRAIDGTEDVHSSWTLCAIDGTEDDHLLGAHCVINNIFTLLGAQRVIDGTDDVHYVKSHLVSLVKQKYPERSGTPCVSLTKQKSSSFVSSSCH
jgi:hypothetical protein